MAEPDPKTKHNNQAKVHSDQQRNAELPTYSAVFGEGVVVIEVGPRQKKYHVHKALLMHHSEYFRKALQGPWKEAEEGVVRLEDIDHIAFNVFVEWLYTQALPTGESYADEWARLLECPIDDWVQERFAALVKAYVIGDRLLVVRFRRLINDHFSDALETNWFEAPACFKIVSYAFANIPLDRLVLQSMVDEHCLQWAQDDGDEADEGAYDKASLQALNELPKSFMLRVMRRLGEFKRDIDEARGIRCYYEHESEEERKDCTVGLHMKYNAVLDYGAFE